VTGSSGIQRLTRSLLDLTKPTNYGDEGWRLLWTLCGVAIAVLVMLLAGLLARHSAKVQPQRAAPPD
jgi:hypothetical protein